MKKILALLTILLLTKGMMAQSFTAGNIVVARLGNGTNTTTSGAMQVSLLEFNPATGAVTNTVNIPSTTAGQRLLINANSAAGSNEGGISLSADGRYIVIGGADVATFSSNTGPSNKSFARINMAGNVDLFTINGTLNGSSNGFIRSTASADGTALVFTGPFGTGYAAWGNTTATTFNFSTTGSRYIQVIGTKLYTVSSTNPATILGFGNVPTSTATNNGTALAGTAASTVQSGYGFALLDLDNTIDNTTDANDVLYIVDQTAASPGIIKMAYNAGTSNWDYIGKYSSTVPFYGLTARVIAGDKVELFTINNFGDNNSVVSIVDANPRLAFNTASITKTTVASAGANFVFRSVAFSPNVAALPLKLTAFSGSSILNGANLKWTTADEVNVKDISLLRKDGNGEFKVVKVVKPKGGTSINFYQTDDTGLSAGTYYYQLKITDLDGSEKTSQIIAVNVNGLGLSIYPNPVNDVLNLQFAAIKTASSVKIYNMNGKLMQQVAIAPFSTTYSLNVSNYIAGTYIVQFHDGNKAQSVSFIKL